MTTFDGKDKNFEIISQFFRLNIDIKVLIRF